MGLIMGFGAETHGLSTFHPINPGPSRLFTPRAINPWPINPLVTQGAGYQPLVLSTLGPDWGLLAALSTMRAINPWPLNTLATQGAGYQPWSYQPWVRTGAHWRPYQPCGLSTLRLSSPW